MWIFFYYAKKLFFYKNIEKISWFSIFLLIMIILQIMFGNKVPLASFSLAPIEGVCGGAEPSPPLWILVIIFVLTLSFHLVSLLYVQTIILAHVCTHTSSKTLEIPSYKHCPEQPWLQGESTNQNIRLYLIPYGGCQCI